MIYFDNAATSVIKPYEVKKAVINAITNLTANPGRSGHVLSQKVADEIFKTREAIKTFLNAEEYSVIFTKNCTEALNLALLGSLKKGDHVIASCYEHNSVLRPLEYLKTQGVEVTILDCDLKDFHLCLEQNIKSNTKLVVTTMVSNVTGETSSVEDVAKICKNKKILYLVDGAQAVGHIKIDLLKLGVDMFAFSGHKGTLSLTGVGCLVVKDLSKIEPIIFGGTGTNSESLFQPTEQIEAFESGTVPSVSIISLKAGIEFLIKNFAKIQEKEQKLNNYMYKKLKNLKFLTNYALNNNKNVFLFNVLDYDSNLIANCLNEQFSICVRGGFHCAPLIHKKLNTITCGAVRVSIDFNNTYQEIDYLIDCLVKISKM